MDSKLASRIKFTLAYDGSNYFGFQRTQKGPSIQAELEKALETILQHPVTVEAASRTDRGVHAEGQVVHFSTIKEIEPARLYVSLRGLLSKDISPIQLELVHPTFHATLENTGKEYHYSICNVPTQMPFHRAYSWHYYEPLDIENMREKARHLIGTHDFSAFSPEEYQDPVRTIESILIEPLPSSRLVIKIRGDNFLYKMVRNIVGHLVNDERTSNLTAPAHGLVLKKVFY